MRALILLWCAASALTLRAQYTDMSPFVEMGGAVHGGDHTPLWQNALQHGLTSTDHYGYLRAGFMGTDSLTPDLKMHLGLDFAVMLGNHQNALIIQQAYADFAWRCLDLSIGSKELTSRFLNTDLSSGDLVWSGNARPIPQVRAGIFDYIPILHASWARIRGEIAYGWWTDNNYLEQQSMAGGEAGVWDEPLRWYTRDILYHHKQFDLSFGRPTNRWQFEASYRLDNQFGGYIMHHPNQQWFPNNIDLGNSLTNYWKALIPQPSNSTEQGLRGETIAREGNILGSETFKFTYTFPTYTLAAYMQNYFDDFSGMGKLNGLDGLWGIEYHNTRKFAPLRAALLEYYQTTNQSGPLHGSDAPDGQKTGGSDDYYNNALYQGWTHWGQGIANPLIASPNYFADQTVQGIRSRGDGHYIGYMGFPYNRIRAIHAGLQGDLTPNWAYRIRLTKSRTWGTPFAPTLTPLDNLSALFEISCAPLRFWGLQIAASVAFDQGEIYGDNIGTQVKLRKHF